MNRAIDLEVRERARQCCEYCRSPQEAYSERFQIDHIVARQHHGETALSNLALCCLECHLRKGPNLTSIDPDTGQLTPLFHPRSDGWESHFVLRGALIFGTTPRGRATAALLELNRPARVAVRAALIDEGIFPTRLPPAQP